MRLQALRRMGIRAGLDALYAGGAHRLFGDATEGRGAILMFHHVRERSAEPFQPNSHLSITPAFLRRVIHRVREAGMEIVDLDEALRRLADPGHPRRFVVLTFDDGYRNNFTDAYPILKGEGAPFTLYVTSGLVDGTAVPWWDVVGEIAARNSHIRFALGDRLLDRRTVSPTEKLRAVDAMIAALITVSEDEQREAVLAAAATHGVDPATVPGSAMMRWEEIRELAADPLATIGAHTVGHFALRRLEEARARREIVDSAKRIEAMAGVVPRHFAYPYGSPDTAGPREFALAAELGFTSAVTTQRGVLFAAHAGRPMALPRISVNGDYQSIRYLDLLLSGVPYAIEKRLNRIRGRATASASI